MNADGHVHILDQVTLTNDQVSLWLGQFHDRYLPGALGRGMHLDRVWRSPAGRDATTVHILWTLPGIRAFYAMRGAAGADPSVAAFWAATDGYALDRGRRALQPTIPTPTTAPDAETSPGSSARPTPAASTGANA
ncbi:hypothetical protein [Streptomyces sp. SID3343]|uniref:hypothetical protein n=1 Tax=Streptomyces sp. SID3343 TaxID=2690260 RepID=UPI00136C1A8C|nr:hypothetical protein [Streptomyces sp. SID3343]MYW05708.1 hypothetical protein [Streptomyces sp. SID3343]